LANSAAFDWICSQLEERTSLDRLEARGTIRLALKGAGLEAGNVRPDQMSVVCEKVLPKELESRGVTDAAMVCQALAREVASIDGGKRGDSPDEVFSRLGG